ncbi:Polysaccharide pyruvyl transferase family protein WcaK [Prosthecobacter debontii]|uniref:Polysaccharide pyruvyl transferase family protein WcaK n=1 Tax=Prosthecobacter debontii TaxID=48467 RepID=A0A1T4XUM5_9BACT|nr:polysaccharide pyruvyl transferase family protein [Prosthecobacter debontii]SKA92848.1 Polysaccharide pyruvyl transferase family protein WcaK [Prosthecobacter debontii]
MPFQILFDGAYGIRSFGDDAPLIVLAETLRKKLGAVECVVVSRHAAEAQYESYGIRAIEGVEYATKAESLGRWFRGFNPDDERADLCRLYDEIAASDLVVLGAGNFLIDITIDVLKGPVPRFLLMSLMARMTGTPVLWYGISVGPLKTRLGRDMSRLAASLASRITVRDEKSLRELKSLEIHSPAIHLPDPVLGLELAPRGTAASNPVWQAAHSEGKSVIAVSVRAVPTSSGLTMDEYLTILASALDKLVVLHDANVLLIPQCIYAHATPDQDDRFTARQLMSRMKEVQRCFSVENELDVYQCAALYEGAKLALCTRLHGCVFAVMNGIPTLALCYHPKVSEFMSWIGFPEFAFAMQDLSVETLLEGAVAVLDPQKQFVAQSTRAIQAGRQNLEEYSNIAIEAMREKVHFS